MDYFIIDVFFVFRCLLNPSRASHGKKKKVTSHKQEHISRKIMRIDWSNVFTEETLNPETDIVYPR